MTTNSMFDDVAEFHRVVLCVEPAESPTLVSPDFIMEKFRFLTEEVNEFMEDALKGDMVRATDGLLDTIYVALGALYSMGIPVQECWNAVQKANMAKKPGMTSRGNKIDAIKPPGWVGPENEIAAAILKRVNASDA